MGKIITIGYNNLRSDDDGYLRQMSAWLVKNGRAELAARIEAKDLDIYDMSTHPEKGDALDAIDDSTDAVIALHIWGIDGREGVTLGPKEWGYDRNNDELLAMCLERRIPLLSAGDQ